MKKCNKYDAKFFKQEKVFFVLYDWYDNLVNYYDNVYLCCDDISKNFNRFRVADLAYKFNISKYDFIILKMLGTYFKLYFFTDDELENIFI